MPRPSCAGLGHRFPNDFWVNFRMAEAPGLGWGGPTDVFPRPAEALRYLTAAVALRPESAMAHDYLGIALHAAGDLPAAAVAQRKAIRLNSDDAVDSFSSGRNLERCRGQGRCCHGVPRGDPAQAR